MYTACAWEQFKKFLFSSSMGNRNIPFWTMHDSFCTLQSWFFAMESRIQELYLSCSHGILPSFKPELCVNSMGAGKSLKIKMIDFTFL